MKDEYYIAYQRERNSRRVIEDEFNKLHQLHLSETNALKNEISIVDEDGVI